MNVADWLAASARLHPNAPALLSGTVVEADYATFARRACALGAALVRDYGVQPGDRVALFMTNCTQYLECMYAVWWIGAAVIPINAKLHGREAAWICDNAGARLAFVDDDSSKALDMGIGIAQITANLYESIQHRCRTTCVIVIRWPTGTLTKQALQVRRTLCLVIKMKMRLDLKLPDFIKECCTFTRPAEIHYLK